MGNGQSSPNPNPPIPPDTKPSSSHHAGRRSASPSVSSASSRRRKSLELPDLAKLSFTKSNNITATSRDQAPTTPTASTEREGRGGAGGGGGGQMTASNELSSPRSVDIPTPTGSTGRAGGGGLVGRKRPSPLAPAMSTTPLSPISTTKAVPISLNPSGSQQPSYFPPPSMSVPVAIPAAHAHLGNAGPPSAGLPDYSRMTYHDEPTLHPEAQHQPRSYAHQHPHQQPQASPAKSNARPAYYPSSAKPTAIPSPSTSSPAQPPPKKTARINPDTASPRKETPIPKSHRQQPSIGDAEGPGDYIRSSLPLGRETSTVSNALSPPNSLSPAGLFGPTSKENDPPKRQEEMADVEGSVGGVPTIINWTGGGKEVFVCGTFAKNWKERVKMNKSTHDFSLVLNLPPGPHRLKFIVDESWKCSDDLATATDGDGTLVNYIEVEPDAMDGEAHTDWGGGIGASTEGVLPEDDSLWTSEIPQALISAQALEESHLNHIAALPPANRQPGSAALANPPGLPNPPTLPGHLQKVILNNPPKDGGLVGVTAGTSSGEKGEKEGKKPMTASDACWTATPDDNSILPIPNHVVLNHLTASAIRNGVLAVGTTTRYKRKYISTILWKPLEI